MTFPLFTMGGLGRQVSDFNPNDYSVVNSSPNLSFPNLAGNSGSFAQMDPDAAQQGWLGRTNGFVNNNFGNWGNVASGALKGIQAIGGIMASRDQAKLARTELRNNRRFNEANLANTMSAFNTRLADRARSRAVQEGQSDADRDRYVEENKLRDRGA